MLLTVLSSYQFSVMLLSLSPPFLSVLCASVAKPVCVESAVFSGQPRQVAAEFRTGGGHIRRIEDGRNDADTFCARGNHFSDRLQINSPNGEPRNSRMIRRPADIIQGHRLGRGFGAGG